MARLIGVLLMFCLLSVPIGAQTADSLPAQAQAAFESGDYPAAVEIYEGLLTAGHHTPEIYYNLGQTYYAEGDLGRALLHFLRAYRLAPRDGEINLNVALMRGLRVDVQPESVEAIDVFGSVTDGIVTTDELAWAAGGVWALFFILLTLWPFVRGSRRLMRYALIGVGGAALVMVAVLAGRVYIEQARPLAVVTAPEILVMSGPGDDYVPLYTLYSAAEMRILEARGDWVRFVLPDGRLGWVRASEIERI